MVLVYSRDSWFEKNKNDCAKVKIYRMASEKTYHHGNLKQVLLDVASEMIRDQGFHQFSLRELARKAGVSHAAPYRHFRDKDQLLCALASQTFSRIADRITYHSLKGIEPKECLERGALAYLRFALERPDEFYLILALPTPAAASPDQVLQALQKLVVSCRFAARDAEAATLMFWSLQHGIAELALRKQPGFQSRKQAIDFSITAVQTLIAGLKPAK
jgi:AcrR family transcriptional regulator